MPDQSAFLLGYDIGSSSVKAALVNAHSLQTLAIAQSPLDEMPITSTQHGFAEQDPEMWWNHLCLATKELLRKTKANPSHILGIGIAYQMHGLVCIDEQQQVIRPAIIWCDSRAVEIGEMAFENIGKEKCLSHLLNSPGNFTASKLRWVQQHEPHVYERIAKVMLPGDFIAMKLTGEVDATALGLSEAILWDFKQNGVSDVIMEHFGFDRNLIPPVLETFAFQGKVTDKAANETSLAIGTPLSYRAGDQPNNALSLNVLKPGEIAASGGTSGVVYGITDRKVFDPQSRINSFMHVNHTVEEMRIGILLCINGAGSQYRWIKQQIAHGQISYPEMEQQASQIPIGSDGLTILPFGNGAERMLANVDIGFQMLYGDFNRHRREHFYRAGLEGIAFAFVYGIRLMQELGLSTYRIKVGSDNLFRSDIFSTSIASLIGCRIDVLDTTGATGAAKAAGVATGLFTSIEEALLGIPVVKSFEPVDDPESYSIAYDRWQHALSKYL